MFQSARVAPIVGEIDRAMREAIAVRAICPSLAEAMEYAALGPGKRVRPVLAWLCGEAVGGHGRETLAAGVALEFVHAFSLVHDDLPAMDDDDLRRGRATLHVARGEAMAILAGDGLLTLAFDVLARDAGDTGLAGALMAELSAATIAMIGGQVLDTLGGDPPESAELRVRKVHEQKTGALIRAACRMGVIAGRGLAPGPKDPALDAVSTYADALGLIFQITDDLMDVEQEAGHVGKRVGKDLEAGKLTFPGVLGVEASRREVGRLLTVAHEALGPLAGAGRVLAELCDAIAHRTR
ncbi:MAG: polyprenyl synthetase family protein [Phycisphaeraceae bacterium]|nr:polyprenyl synthetase family protein [Phycisphaeraceae bacterium]